MSLQLSLLKLLDARIKYDQATEFPEVFEEYLCKSNRRPREFMFESIQQICLNTRNVQQFKIDLPDQTRSSLLLRVSQVGTNLMFERVVVCSNDGPQDTDVSSALDRRSYDHEHRECHDTGQTTTLQTNGGATAQMKITMTDSRK